MTRGSGIELFLLGFGALVVARKIVVVVGDEFLHRGFHRGLPVAELAGFWRRHQQWPVLGADGVVWA